MPLLIDGYNLLYAIGLLGRGLGPGGLERSRLALVGHLAAALEPEELARTTIVFDAAGAPPGLPSTLNSHGLTIRFAVGYDEADTLIEELIRAEPNPKRLVVVSSDHRIQRAARRRRATAVDSETWYDDVERRRRQRSEPASQAVPARPAVPLVEDEVAYWLGLFGGEAVVERVRAEERARSKQPRPESGDTSPLDEPPPPDPHGGKLTAEEAEAIDNPFPPGYGEDLLDDPARGDE